MRRIRANGMGIIAIANPKNPLYDGNANVHTPAGLEALGRWVAALARHWSGTNVWWELCARPAPAPALPPLLAL